MVYSIIHLNGILMCVSNNCNVVLENVWYHICYVVHIRLNWRYSYYTTAYSFIAILTLISLYLKIISCHTAVKLWYIFKHVVTMHPDLIHQLRQNKSILKHLVQRLKPYESKFTVHGGNIRFRVLWTQRSVLYIIYVAYVCVYSCMSGAALAYKNWTY